MTLTCVCVGVSVLSLYMWQPIFIFVKSSTCSRSSDCNSVLSDSKARLEEFCLHQQEELRANQIYNQKAFCVRVDMELLREFPDGYTLVISDILETYNHITTILS